MKNVNMSKRIFCIVVCCVLLLGGSAHSVEKPASVTIGYMDFDKVPHWRNDGTGLDITLARMACNQLGIDVKFELLPWRRLLKYLKESTLDGALGPSFSKKRLNIAKYPLTSSGEPNESAALHMDGYTFYKRKGDPFDYDGERFINFTGKIGANSGFSIVKKLKKKGIEVEDSAKTTKQNLKKLYRGRLQVVVDSGIRADYHLKNNAELQTKIVKVPTPYGYSGRYLIFSNGFYQQYPKIAEQLWTEIRKIKNSEAFQQLTKEAWQ
ncbi:MAG: amino acid ABC transporter substrate-binding protein [Desulfobacteraceae bacterium]|nr:amino acid ABC transporter substrate-binding protein [Desulfobacteraceae bacterium]